MSVVVISEAFLDPTLHKLEKTPVFSIELKNDNAVIMLKNDRR
jgi:hypothetical protein